MLDVLLAAASYGIAALGSAWFIYWDSLRRGASFPAWLAVFYGIVWPIGLGLHLLLRPRVTLAPCPLCIQRVSLYAAKCPVCGVPREIPPEEPSTARPWGLGDAVGIMVLCLSTNVLCLSLEMAVAPMQSPEEIGWRHLALPLVCQIAAFWALPLVAVGVLARDAVGKLGWTGRRWHTYVVAGLAGAVVLLLVSGGGEWLTQWVIGILTDTATAEATMQSEEMNQVALLLPKHPLSLPALAFLSLVTIWGPVSEEVYFRGLTYTALRNQWGAGWALIVSSLLFSSLHLAPAHLPVLFLVGVGLTVLRQRTGSLLPGIAAHIGFNTALVISYYGKGLA